jgi:PilZ domain
MNKRPKVRQRGRFPVRMKILSKGLPQFQADILDLSEGGARVRLRDTPEHPLTNKEISFGARVPSQVYAAFDGVARVVWENRTMDGFVIGLEWKNLTSKAIASLKDAILGAAI